MVIGVVATHVNFDSKGINDGLFKGYAGALCSGLGRPCGQT